MIPDPILSRLKDGRWSPDGESDGIIVNGAKDQRAYLPTIWGKP